MKHPFTIEKYNAGNAKVVCRSFMFTPRNIEIYADKIIATVNFGSVPRHVEYYTDGRFWHDINSGFDLMIYEEDKLHAEAAKEAKTN